MFDTTFKNIIESRKIRSAASRIARIQAHLDLGVDIDITDANNRTGLFLICKAGELHAERPHPAKDERFELARFLLEAGADPNKADIFNLVPLHEIASNNDVELARIIFELGKGVDINARDQYDATPLHEACANGHFQIVKLLLEHGADPRIADKAGADPLKLVTDRPWDPIWHRHREEIIDLFREFHPELVMERWITRGPSL